MADNLQTDSPSKITGDDIIQNNSKDKETDKDRIVSPPPTQNKSDSDEKEGSSRTENVQDEQTTETDKTELVTDTAKLNEPFEKTEQDVSEENTEEVQDIEGKEDMLVDEPDSTEETVDDKGACNIEKDAALKVELPPTDIDTDSSKVTKTGTVDIVDEGACGNSAARNGRPLDDSESIHQVKWIYFKKKQVPIVTQNENGPCPLLALMNVMLLQNRVTLPPQTEIISAGQLMHHLGDSVLQNVPGEDGVSTPSRLNFEQNMGDAMAVMYKLQTGLDVNVRFTGVRDFEYTSECIIFDLLQIPLYHGWLVDPQNDAEVEALGKCSYNQLVEKIILQKTSDQPDLVNQALVAEVFLENSASQLTYHGLSELCTQLKEDELAVLFRNNHFTTLYKYKGELFQLVTDQGFLQESNVVWETLSNVEGDCHFVDSEFRTYTKPEPPPLSNEPSSVPINSEEQIDHDYLVALSLQQEQQPVAWSPQNAQMSDEELAKHLQEEERRAAMAEANDAQQRQGQQAPRQQGQQSSSQRRPVRGSGQHREDKKDCCIL